VRTAAPASAPTATDGLLSTVGSKARARLTVFSSPRAERSTETVAGDPYNAAAVPTRSTLGPEKALTATVWAKLIPSSLLAENVTTPCCHPGASLPAATIRVG